RRYGDVNGEVYSEHMTNLALGETRVSGGVIFFGAKPKKRKLTLLIVYIIATLILDLIIFQLLINSAPRFAGEFLIGAAIGTVFGQIGFASLVAGLGSIRWIRGYLIGILLTFAGFVCLFGGAQLASQRVSTPITDSFWSIAVLPLGVLATSASFALSRLFVGWHLTRRETDLPRLQFSINDYLTMTAVIGSLILFARVPQNYWQFPSVYYWPTVASVSASFAGLGLIIFFPAAILSLVFKSPLRTLIAQMGFALGLCLFASLWASMPYVSIRNLLPGFVSILCGCGTIFLGTIALRASGFRLARACKPSGVTGAVAKETRQSDVANESPWSDVEEEGYIAQTASPGEPLLEKDTKHPSLGFWDSNRGARICAAAIFGVATIGSFSTYALHRQRMSKIGALSEQAETVYASGGTIEADSRSQSITKVILPPSTGASDLLNITSSPSLTYLDISGCDIGDESIDAIIGLGPIVDLNISGTKFSASGVLELVRALPLGRLYIAEMSIPKQQFVSLLQNREMMMLMNLDISDSGLSYADLDPIWRDLPMGLAVRGCGLTDAQLSKLLKKRVPRGEFDLGDNQLTGTFLPMLGNMQDLNLENNPLVDASFNAAAGGRFSVRRLSLGKSQLTTGVFASLPKLSVAELALSDGAFDEEDLTN
ncbi:MAG: leucine-rich repeat domain-containing protein, partial [Planctomycetota bacterium]